MSHNDTNGKGNFFGDLGDGEAVGRDCAAGGLFVYGLALGEELGDALVELLSVGVG